MQQGYLDIATTETVRAAQRENGSEQFWTKRQSRSPNTGFTEAETDFIALRDSFYLATVSESGWPYIQHRGGPPGFLHVLDSATLAFADFSGNRQYLTIGNLKSEARASLFLMDYPARRRLKLFAHLEVSTDRDLKARLSTPSTEARIERVIKVHLDAFDWNCPQYITPRFTEADLAPLRDRLAALETENAALRRQLNPQK